VQGRIGAREIDRDFVERSTCDRVRQDAAILKVRNIEIFGIRESAKV
jgi:hypothetical protein